MLALWHPGRMQWHWGNIGSAAAGLAALIATVFAVSYAIVKRQGPAWLQAVRERESAQADAAREQAGLAHEQAEQIRLDRRRSLQGWSRGGLATYAVALVTSAAEMDRARDELTSGAPSDYVILRVAESDEKYGNVNRAHSLRQLIEPEGLMPGAPTAGEREALETGLDTMGVLGQGPAGCVCRGRKTRRTASARLYQPLWLCSFSRCRSGSTCQVQITYHGPHWEAVSQMRPVRQ